MNNTSVFDSNLNPVLEMSSNEDLDVLVEYLRPKLSETLTVSDAYKRYAPEHTKYADLIAKELRDMGGNSFMNAFRGFEGPSYHEIVCDVASKLKAPFNKNKDTADIENAILEKILEKTLENMSEEEKEELLEELGAKGSLGIGGISTTAFITLFRAGGFYSYQLTLIIANQIARLILGRGLLFATNTTIVRAMSVIAGPIGLAAASLWTAVDIASPSYKVTIPSVVHIAMLRKKLNASTCPSCNSLIADPSSLFCPSCGHNLQ